MQEARRLWRQLLPFQLALIVGVLGLATGLCCASTFLLMRGELRIPGPATPQPTRPVDMVGTVFTPEVQHWAPKIMEWSRQYAIEPNILATVIQIESCGDFQAGSGAGAEGLFQVMPFHFQPGEDMHDPDTNARRGIEYLKGGLALAGGHIGLAMAGYNGGWGVIGVGWAGWTSETRSYYLWGAQIYLDAIHSKLPGQSSALQDWLNAGGARLCAQAAARLATPTSAPGTPPPQN